MRVVMTDADEAARRVIQLRRYSGVTLSRHLADLIAENPGVTGLDAAIFVFVKGDSGHEVSSACATICKV